MQGGRERPMSSVDAAVPEPTFDPTAPPPVLAPVPAALAAARERRAADGRAPADPRTLQFGHDPVGRLRIDVYDGAGQLVRSIPPNTAMAEAMGGRTWQG
jgi:hypothetical protein